MASREVERGITELARGQHGVVTRRQLLELGLGPRAISRRAASRQWARLFRGTYVVGPIAPPRAREMAAVLACGPTAVISHRSAAGLWSVVTTPPAADPVDVTVVGRSKEMSGIRARGTAAFADDEWTRVDGIPVTSIGRTLVDFAAVASLAELERVVARAERESLITPPALDALLTRYHRRPGIPAMRAVLKRSGGPALLESEAEKIFLRDVVRKGGLPAPPDQRQGRRLQARLLLGRARGRRRDRRLPVARQPTAVQQRPPPHHPTRGRRDPGHPHGVEPDRGRADGHGGPDREGAPPGGAGRGCCPPLSDDEAALGDERPPWAVAGGGGGGRRRVYGTGRVPNSAIVAGPWTR